MKNIKKILIGLLALIMLFSLMACSTNTSNNTTSTKEETQEEETALVEEKNIRVSTAIAPYSIPIFYMQEANLLGDNIILDISVHKNRQEAVARINKNDVDIVNLSLQEMAHMHNKNMPIHFLDVSNWATFKLMTLDESITSWEDLERKEIYSSSKGGPIDLLTSVVLKHHNLIDGENITITYMNQGELAQMASNELKDITTFVLREPFASQAKINNPSIKTLYNLGDAWSEIYGHGFPQSGTGAVSSFMEKDSDLAELFVEKHQDAIDWVLNNPEEAAKIGEKYLKSFSKEVLVKSIKNMDMYTLPNIQAKEPLEIYYQHILDFNPEMIGNKMPDDSFYE